MWRFGPVRRLLVSNFALFAGVALQAVALQKQAFDITGREADIGFIGLAEFLPAALLVLVTGSVADRFDRRIVALFAVGGELVSSLALMMYAITEPTSVFPLFVIAFGYGIARAFQAPAMRSMPPMVAPEGGLPRTIALFSATWTAAIIIGPALSGFLYAVDPWVAYAGLVDADPGRLGRRRRGAVRAPPRAARPGRAAVAALGDGGAAVHPAHAGAARGDLARPVRGAVRRRGRAAAGDRRGASARRRRRVRVAARRARASAPRRWRSSSRCGRCAATSAPTLLASVAVFGAATVVLGVTRSYVVAFVALIVLSAADMVSVFIRGRSCRS